MDPIDPNLTSGKGFLWTDNQAVLLDVDLCDINRLSDRNSQSVSLADRKSMDPRMLS